ncbi:MAG: CoA transferase [Caulobacteraceae bacterium]|nr:CoA transferase [Caulobacteraceae bacterium]
MLEGLKVVELATYIAGPGAGGVMADWGAEVVKIESPAGDPMRRFFDSLSDSHEGNPVFEMDNRGKRSIALDITKPEGREAAARLIAGADVFLTNVRPAALKRAGLDYDSLGARYPRLIYCSLTGYGLQGPDADKPGFDVTAFWARSGVASLTAPKGIDPFGLRTGVGDHTCSLATVSAILAAVFERGRTGKGRLVETSLLRTGVYAIATDMAIQLRLGKIASTRPREQAVNPLANYFKTADGHWLCLNPRDGGADWPDLARALGQPELASDPRFAKGRERRTNGAELVRTLDAAFAGLTLAEAAARLDEADIVWAPVQTPAECAADPQAQAAGCFVETPNPKGGTFRAPAAPARFPGADDGPKGPAPALGQHTREVLAGVGYSPAEIERLLAEGAAA